MMALLVLLVSGLCVPGVVLLARYLDMHYWRNHLKAYEVRWPSGMESPAVSQWLANVAAMTHPPKWSLLPLPPMALELTATSRGVRYHLLLPTRRAEQLLAGLRAAVPGVRITEDAAYMANPPALRVAAELKLTSHTRPLGFARAEGTSAALLASLQPLSGADETVRVQWIFTSAGTPAPAHTASPKQADTWWPGYVFDGSLPADAEAVQALRLKHRSPLLAATARLAVAAPSQKRAYALFGRSWGTFHGLNASGVRIVRRWLSSAAVVHRAMARSYPVGRWPLSVNTEELTGLLGLPIGGVALPGVATSTARQLPPPAYMAASGTVIAQSNYPGMQDRLLTVRVEDRLRHTLAVGPTGSGKSWLLTRLILQDIAAGRGVFAIDLKGDLIHDIVSRVSDADAERLIVVDPSQRHMPVGLNVLGGAHDEAARELVVDNTLHVFKELWAAYWGPRSDQIMRAALNTLVATRAADGSVFTLVELVPLLTNPTFRRFVVAQHGLSDSVRTYWQRYDAMTENERMNSIAPILNKVDAFTGRTAIRLLLGQSDGLDLRDIFRKRSVVLVNLAKGTHGSETSNLLGALLILKLWQAALERVQVPAERRHPAFAYIDEAQDLMRLPIPIADVFAQARGLGLGLTVAHQYFAQLPEHIKAAELGTVRTQILFATEYEDAKLLEQRFSPLTSDDLMGLEAYEVAARLCVGGRTLSPVTGLTLPLGEPLRGADLVLAASQQRHGQLRQVVESAIAARITVPSSAGRGRFGREASGGEA
jgi:hypothetical protein